MLRSNNPDVSINIWFMSFKTRDNKRSVSCKYRLCCHCVDDSHLSGSVYILSQLPHTRTHTPVSFSLLRDSSCTWPLICVRRPSMTSSSACEQVESTLMKNSYWSWFVRDGRDSMCVRLMPFSWRWGGKPTDLGETRTNV